MYRAETPLLDLIWYEKNPLFQQTVLYLYFSEPVQTHQLMMFFMCVLTQVRCHSMETTQLVLLHPPVKQASMMISAKYRANN